MVMKSKFTKLLLVLTFGSALLFFPQISYAATHYASPTGSATWANSTNISTPCSLTIAITNAVAGDLVYLRGGTYSYSSPYNAHDLEDTVLPAPNAGTGDAENQRVIFRAYTGETPIIEITWTGGGAGPNYIKAIGFNSYVTWDRITLRATNNNTAAVCMCGGGDTAHITGAVLKNSTIIGGSNTNPCIADNVDMIRFEDCDNCKIQNNTLGPYTCDGYSDNGSLIKLYHIVGGTIENNKLWGSNSLAISMKGYTQNTVIRYNWFHNNLVAIRGNQGSWAGNNSNGQQIYQNVFYQPSSSSPTNVIDLAWESGALGAGWLIYNNTALAPDRGFFDKRYGGSFTGAKMYNNCTIVDPKLGYELEGYLHVESGGTFAEEDHNQWGNDGTFRIYWNGTNYTSLSSWQSSGVLIGGVNPGTYGGSTGTDLASNPLFTNGSGNYSLLSDFKLQANSLCKGAGRGGVDMGANIFLVGPNPNVKIPNPPTALR